MTADGCVHIADATQLDSWVASAQSAQPWAIPVQDVKNQTLAVGEYITDLSSDDKMQTKRSNVTTPPPPPPSSSFNLLKSLWQSKWNTPCIFLLCYFHLARTCRQCVTRYRITITPTSLSRVFGVMEFGLNRLTGKMRPVVTGGSGSQSGYCVDGLLRHDSLTYNVHQALPHPRHSALTCIPSVRVTLVPRVIKWMPDRSSCFLWPTSAVVTAQYYNGVLIVPAFTFHLPKVY